MSMGQKPERRLCHCPRGARPYRRVSLVVKPLPAMNTRWSRSAEACALALATGCQASAVRLLLQQTDQKPDLSRQADRMRRGL